MSKTIKNPTKLQSILAVASFIVGTIIGCISLFVIPPPDVISNSALGLTSEFLILCAAMLGVNVAFDYKLSKFKTNVKKSLEDNNIEYEEQEDADN
jgi:hypothetical protein